MTAKYRGSVNLKIVRYSGTSKSEIFYYDREKEIYSNIESIQKNKGAKKGSCKDDAKKMQNQTLSNYRAKAKMKKVMIENGLRYHYITTYRDIEENRLNTLKDNYRDMVLYDNKKFLKRLSYNAGHKIDYVAVPEVQIERFKKYGCNFLHMHIALNELIDERLFWACWNSIKCLKCDGYLTRKNVDDDFKCNNCIYFSVVISVKDDEKDVFETANYFTKYFFKDFENSSLSQRSFN